MGSGGSRLLELFGWALVAVSGTVMLTQAFGWAGSRTVAIAQSFTPYLAVSMWPLAVGALVTRRVELAAVAVSIGVGGVVLALPLLRPGDRRRRHQRATGDERLRIASVNLLYTNERIADVAADLAVQDLDVIMFCEYTPAHQRCLLQSSLADRFAHRTDRADAGGSGIAVWSKTPVVVAPHPDTRNYSLDVAVATDAGPVRVIAVHPPTPVADFAEWRRDLATIGALGRTPASPDGDVPTAIVGDFNASFWHPSLRELLDDGYVGAHDSVGRGLSVSWPDDRRFPPFVRLDHALVNDRLVVTAVDDIDIAGSDHRGFVVTVARVR